MTKKTMSKTGFSWILSVVLLVVVSGCRRQETVAIATVEPAAVETQDNSVPEATQQSLEPSQVGDTSVRPVPYRPPVQAQPPAAAPAQTQTVLAQYPAPVQQTSPPPARPTPELITIPVGTIVRVRIDDHLSSHSSRVGQQFNATVTQDVAAQGRVAIRSGDRVNGRVIEAEPAKKIGGRARLSLDFDTLVVGAGQQRPMSAQFAQAGKSQTAKDAAIIGGSTIGGAIIGEAIEDGEGGVIGAIVGGLGGAYAAKKTKAKPVEIPAGTVVDLELTEPITLELYSD